MAKTKPPRSPKPRRRWALWGLGAAALAAAAGPTLIGLSPLPAMLLADALPASAGRLSAGSIGLSWTGPLAVSGLELTDTSGQKLFAAERVAIDGGLLGLAPWSAAPLVVTVDRPKVEVVAGPKGTNFDHLIDALQRKAAANAPADAAAPAAPTKRRPLTVRVRDAAALVTDTASGGRWLAEGVSVELNDPGRGVDALEVAVEGKIGPSDPAAARGAFTLRLGPADGGRRVAKVAAQGVPLAAVAPLLRRTDRTADAAGTLGLEGTATWAPAGGAIDTSPAGVLRALVAGGLQSSGVARVEGAQYSGAATLRGPIRIEAVEVPWRVAAAGSGLAIQQLDVTSDLARLTATGSITPDEVNRWAAGLAAAPRDLRLKARIELDRFARAAPQLVRLRDGARLESGRIDAAAEFAAGRVVASLATGPLAGVAGERRIEWREPLDVRLAAVERAPGTGLAGWALEGLRAKSSFFSADAAGDAAVLEGTAEFDLDRLAKELAPLVSLGDTRLEGSGTAKYRVARDEARRRWRLEAIGRLERLFVGAPSGPLAEEAVLDLDAKLAGDLAPGTLPAGEVILTAGEDSLSVTLPEAAGAGGQPFRLRLGGDAARWLRRAKLVAPTLPSPEEIALAGSIDVSAEGAAGAGGGRVDRLDLALKRLAIDTAALGDAAPRVRFRDERIEASGAASWSVAERTAQCSEGTLVSSVASARLRDVLVSLSNPADSRGEALFRTDLERLGAWLPPRTGRARYAFDGDLEGSASLRGAPEGLAIKLDGRGRGLAIADREATNPDRAVVWSEPDAQLKVDALLATLTDVRSGGRAYALDLRDAQIDGQSLKGSCGGRIADLAAARGVQLGGGVDYDLERLTPMLWPALGDGVRLVGRDRATFRIETDDEAPAGAAPIARLRGSVAAPWEGADLFGLPVGAGRLAATLERGVVRLEPLDVSIGGGRLTAAAAATLDPPPETLTVRPGPLLTDVAVSRDVTDRVLKFIAPVLADATRIDGRFSLSLTECSAPLVQPPGGPPAGRAAGVLRIAQVRVTPGPSVAEWVALVQRIVGVARDGVESVVQPSEVVLVAIRDSAIDFQLADGRVYHRGLVFYVGDARVESSGSVGLDETLDLVLSVPILDQWIDKRPQFLGGLRGKSIRIPIRGTLDRPKVNADALRELSAGVLESAAAGALEGGLNLLLERLKSK